MQILRLICIGMPGFNLEKELVDLDALNLIFGIVTIFSLFFGLWVYWENKSIKKTTREVEGNEIDKNSKKPVEQFYNSIQDRNYLRAWEALTENIKKMKWGNNIEFLKSGYENTQSLNDIIIFPLSTENPRSHNYGVFYRSSTLGYIIPELTTLRFQTLKDSGEIFQIIETIRKRLVNLGANEKEVNSLEVKALIKENASDYIRYKLNLSSEAMAAEFTRRTDVIESIGIAKVSVTKDNNKNWKVDSINNLIQNA